MKRERERERAKEVTFRDFSTYSIYQNYISRQKKLG